MTLDFEKATTVVLDDRFPILETKVPGTRYYRGIKHLDNLSTDQPRMIKSHLHYFLLPDDITQRKKGKVMVNLSINLPCGSPKQQPRTSSIVQFIFYFWSFEISRNILRNQQIL